MNSYRNHFSLLDHMERLQNCSSHGPFRYFCLLCKVLNWLNKVHVQARLRFCPTFLLLLLHTDVYCLHNWVTHEYHLTKSTCSLLSPLLIHQGRQKTTQWLYTEIISMFTLCIIPFIFSPYNRFPIHPVFSYKVPLSWIYFKCPAF
jgi:hypothetical protein